MTRPGRIAPQDVRVFCICLVKDEGDIIEECLEAAATWAHRIFVYDNGSTDGTWEKVRALAAREPKVVPFLQDPKTFQDHMRQEVFAVHGAESRAGDWWAVLDGDEFYHEDPRVFLSRIPPQYQAVWNLMVTFMLTDRDVARYEQNPALYADDVPAREKMRWYRTTHSEPRFFRYDRALRWPAGERWPMTGALYPERIPTWHYPYRSPEQTQRRIDVRQAALAKGSPVFRHERDSPPSWRDRVVSVEAARLKHYAGDGRFELDEEGMTPLPASTRLPPVLVNALRNLKLITRRFSRKS